ncbi:DNA-processing protein DprA [Candidatus Soleaferrea massiliensis]|uniref:DNA-processing protein DprA n=1 Tax=Candidatus Soleaferrea massiliensis TaxID=1470354 RepID=UPI000694760D|nr:DNA-processing protein DprA [Candidatus Soleaferrea massiliensis]
MTPKEYWIWLQLSLGQGSGKLDDILLQFDTPEAFYRADERERRAVRTLTAADFARLKRTGLAEAQKVIKDCARIGCRILTPDDGEFPSRLRNIYGMPGALYVQGSLADIDQILTIAMVGTRTPSDYGKYAAKRIGYDLAREGAVIASGCAVGIDTLCHRAALAAGKPTIAFLGCGLDVDYPAENRQLKRDIAAIGALVTEYPPGTPPLGRNFPIRNRLISGISLGTVVVEAPSKSGSLITAEYALEQGKDVFAVPNNIFSGLSAGTTRLLKQGANPIDSAADVLMQYRGYLAGNVQNLSKNSPEMPLIIKKDPEPKRMTASAPVTKKAAAHTVDMEKLELSAEAKAVWEVLSERPMPADEIFAKVDMMMGDMLAVLTELEIEGLVRSYPGNQFGRNNDTE